MLYCPRLVVVVLSEEGALRQWRKEGTAEGKGSGSFMTSDATGCGMAERRCLHVEYRIG